MKYQSKWKDIIAQFTGGCGDCDDNDIWESDDSGQVSDDLEEEPDGIQRTEAPAKLDKCVEKVTKQLVDKFKDKNNKSPSKTQLKKLKSSAWAICQKQMKSNSNKKRLTREDAYKYLDKVLKEKSNG
jgi:predicted metal-dependent hydrolase